MTLFIFPGISPPNLVKTPLPFVNMSLADALLLEKGDSLLLVWKSRSRPEKCSVTALWCYVLLWFSAVENGNYDTRYRCIQDVYGNEYCWKESLSETYLPSFSTSKSVLLSVCTHFAENSFGCLVGLFQKIPLFFNEPNYFDSAHYNL